MADSYQDWGDARPAVIYLDPGDGGLPQRLRALNGALPVVAIEQDFTQIRAARTAVSTLASVSGWMDLSTYRDLRFSGWTEGVDVTMTIERSDDGIHADAAQNIDVATGSTGAAVEISNRMARYWRVSANTTNPFPTAQFNWVVTGRPRSVA